MQARRLLLAGATAYTTQGRDFDGTNDYASLGSAPTGLADGKAVTCSFWYRDDRAAQNTTEQVIGSINGAALRLGIRITNTTLTITGSDSGGVSKLQVSKAIPALDAAWHHVVVTVDLTSTSNRYFSIDGDTTGVTWSTYVNAGIDMAGTDFTVGTSSTAGALKFNGCLSELWFNDEYLASPLSKFYVAGKPISLGVDGSTPTGNQPVLYLPYGDPADNKGTGGNLTVTGSLDVSSTSPTD